ncbi:hypothetical protein TNCV_2251481 [Trichonephila clavipes]|nr:hypothetical protein TNCV_2251481 [Trichonephila clavipes]
MSVDEIASMRPGYKALRAHYRKSIIDTKNKAWESFCSTNSNNFGLAFKAAFGNLTSPTNLHQITTGDPAFLFHSKISLLLDSHFPSGASPIPLVLNDCFLLKLGRDPSSLSYRPISLFSSLGKILERIFLVSFFFGLLRIMFYIGPSSALGKTAAALEAVDKLVHHIKNTKVHKHSASTFFDIISAFGNVDWSTLFHIFHLYIFLFTFRNSFTLTSLIG